MSSDLLYTPWLVTLAYVRRHRRLAALETRDDALLRDLIAECSAKFAGMCGRVCVPYQATKTFEVSRRMQRNELRIEDDLLEASSVTDTESVIVVGSNYRLLPDNAYPKHTIQLTQTSGLTWAFNTFDDRASITGWWGYAPHYAGEAWEQGTTLAAGIDNATMTITLALADALEVGQYVRIDTELLFVTAVSGTICTVQRGKQGTVKAAHLINAPINVFQPLADIRQAVREMVVYEYLVKDQMGGRVTVYNGTAVQVTELDPMVHETARRHRRFQMPIAL